MTCASSGWNATWATPGCQRRVVGVAGRPRRWGFLRGREPRSARDAGHRPHPDRNDERRSDDRNCGTDARARRIHAGPGAGHPGRAVGLGHDAGGASRLPGSHRPAGRALSLLRRGLRPLLPGARRRVARGRGRRRGRARPRHATPGNGGSAACQFGAVRAQASWPGGRVRCDGTDRQEHRTRAGPRATARGGGGVVALGLGVRHLVRYREQPAVGTPSTPG